MNDSNPDFVRVEGEFDTLYLAVDGLSRIAGETMPQTGISEMLTLIAEKVDRIRATVLPLLAPGR